MIIADYVVSGAVAMASAGIVTAVVTSFTSRERQDLRAKIDDQDTWREESDSRLDGLQAECDNCQQSLEKTRRALRFLIEDLEDQIVPALLLPTVDTKLVRIAVRLAAQKARDAL